MKASNNCRSAFEQASRGEIPNPLPCEIYCHSITDPTILGQELRESGAQTLTVFAIQAPHSLLRGKDNGEMRQAFEDAVLDSINYGVVRGHSRSVVAGRKRHAVYRNQNHARPRERPRAAWRKHLPRATELAVRLG
jgi:phytoene dehydrogenase-like protein